MDTMKKYQKFDARLMRELEERKEFLSCACWTDIGLIAGGAVGVGLGQGWAGGGIIAGAVGIKTGDCSS